MSTCWDRGNALANVDGILELGDQDNAFTSHHP